MKEFVVPTAAEMRALGAALVREFQPGDLVALEGELGAGKTTLVRGMLEGLGWAEPVRSPTYNLVQVFATEPPVLHADLYRLQGNADLITLGLEDYLDTHVCLVEWPERSQQLTYSHTINITVEDSVRRVKLDSIQA